MLFSVLSGYVVFSWASILYLLKKCLEIGVITAFVMLPFFKFIFISNPSAIMLSSIKICGVSVS
ncbi:ABC transporter permease [Clostridioides difficile]